MIIKVKMKNTAAKPDNVDLTTYVLRNEKGDDVGAIDRDADGLFQLPDNVAKAVIDAGEGDQVGDPIDNSIQKGGDAPGAVA